MVASFVFHNVCTQYIIYSQEGTLCIATLWQIRIVLVLDHSVDLQPCLRIVFSH